MSESIEEIFKRYHEEFKSDCAIDEFSLKDKCIEILSIKQKWIQRVIEHKQKLNAFTRKRKEAIRALALNIQQTQLGVTFAAAEKLAKNDERIQALDDTIADLETLIEYLEKVEKTISSSTWDYKNLIEVVKLENV